LLSGVRFFRVIIHRLLPVFAFEFAFAFQPAFPKRFPSDNLRERIEADEAAWLAG
jgi:hypothetical protein